MENQEEIWKDIVGYEGLYKISNNGVVKSLKRRVNNAYNGRTVNEKIISMDNWEYPRVLLSKHGKQKTHPLHRILAIAFIPNPENKKTVNHINGIKSDFRLENLEWNTHSENLIHAYQVLNVYHYKKDKQRIIELRKQKELLKSVLPSPPKTEK